MNIKKQYFKGQVFLKYLWQHSAYKRGDTGVSPVLSKDIKDIAVSKGFIEPNKKVDNSMVFHWIADSVIPKWVRLSAFELAIRHAWQPVDFVDVMSIIYLNTDKPTKQMAIEMLTQYKEKYALTYPNPVIKKVLDNIE